jgi:uncharacterized membrane protein
VNIYKYIKKFNETVALSITLGMGTVWCVYLFFILSILPLVIPSWTTVVMYISTTIIQLVALPAIMVGQQLLGRNSELRAEQDHETILAEFSETKELHTNVNELLQNLVEEFAETKQIHENINVMITNEMTDSADIKELHAHMHRISEKVLANAAELQELSNNVSDIKNLIKDLHSKK